MSAQHITVIFACVVMWLAAGFFVSRSRLGWGDTVAMIHYNYPWLGLLMLFLTVVLWPVVLIFSLVAPIIGWVQIFYRDNKTKQTK
jgi:hypothetical protein